MHHIFPVLWQYFSPLVYKYEILIKVKKKMNDGIIEIALVVCSVLAREARCGWMWSSLSSTAAGRWMVKSHQASSGRKM